MARVTIDADMFADAHHYGGRYASEELRAMVVSPPVGSPRLKGGKQSYRTMKEGSADEPETRAHERGRAKLLHHKRTMELEARG